MTLDQNFIRPEYVASDEGSSEIHETPSRVEVAVEQVKPRSFTLALDTGLYVLFGAIALATHLIQLGAIVLNDSESHEALAIFRALNPSYPGTPLVSHQPLPFVINSIVMAIGGANNFTARIATSIVGVLIVLIPFLYRRWIGRSTALIASGFLAISPVLLTASRTMSGSVWSIALALSAVWLIGQFVETRRTFVAVLATTLLIMLTLTTEMAGFLVTIMIAVGLLFASGTDETEIGLGLKLRQILATWPWLVSLVVGVITTVALCSVFWIYPQGVSAIGDTLNAGLRGFIFHPTQNPIIFPLLTSVIYEPALWIFGLVGAWLTLRGEGTLLHRALLGWLVTAVVACLIYPGAGAEDALWLTIPLVGLSALVVSRLFAPIVDQFWNVPTWGPWLHGLGMIAILCIAVINLMSIGQAILNTAASLTPALNEPFRVVLVGLTVALAVILFFLVGSVWGNKTAWHGTGIGILVVLSVYGLSSGWHASVVNADDPREFWRVRAVSQNLQLLDSELYDTTLRSSGMRNTMPLTVVGSDDSPIAWIIRNYTKVTYVLQSSSSITTPAVLIPSELDHPVLGTAYVGQPFTEYVSWDRGSMQGWDIIPWLYNRASRIQPQAESRVVLWVRADVYGVPTDSLNAATSAAAPQRSSGK